MRTFPRLFLLLLLGYTALFSSGCQRLMIRKTDGKGVVAAKVAARIVQVACTVGMSEIHYARIRHMNGIMASWVGKDVNHLLRAWGPPALVLPDGSGGRIYCFRLGRSHTSSGSAYTYHQFHGSPGHLQGSSYTTYGPRRTAHWTVSRNFWVNAEGRVYKWEWRGL